MSAAFPPHFLWGAATSAHQTEGNNTGSDLWALENAPDSPLRERSGDACDSLHRWQDDLDLVARLGLTAYRFSVEWARVEPAPGRISRAMLGHYRRIIEGCLSRGITPVVTLHHFTSPLWLRTAGGWGASDAPDLFARYARAVRPYLDGVEWVCTINEPNMLATVAAIRALGAADGTPAGLPEPDPGITAALTRAHHAARAVLKGVPGLKTGWTVASQPVQVLPGGEALAEKWRWLREDQFLEAAAGDDFVGVQAYTRTVIGPNGAKEPAEDARRTLTGWEFYPGALEDAVRHTAALIPGVPLLVTENGIATGVDDERIEYTRGALTGLQCALADGIDVRGYLHWSLLDNYEWGSYTPTFGLAAVDPRTFERRPKPSARWYAAVARANALPPERPPGPDALGRGVLDGQDLVAALSTAQKAGLTSGADFWQTKAVPEAGVPAITMADGPHGLRKQPDGDAALAVGVSLPATCFPPAVALGSSWNPALAEQVGAAIGAEAVAADVSLVLGPGINIKRSPLCGRNFEYVSEDPLLSGRIGAALVRGIQAEGVGACVKHFAANNQESDRLRVSAEVDERTLREIYLPAFEHAVTAAGPRAVMSAYNKVNGVYASENRWLLTEVLRGEWGFEGVVISDWGAIDDRAAALAAGCDLAMPVSRADAAIAELVDSGELDGALLDASAGRVLELIARTAPGRARTRPARFDAGAHHDLARRAAREGAVLLKNTGSLLPLDPTTDTRIAVIGELARTPRFQGGGSSHVVPTRIDNALDAIIELLAPNGRVVFAPGYALDPSAMPADDTAPSPALLSEAVAAAGEAGTVLLFLGLPEAAESEGRDRSDIALPAEQIALVHAVAAANPRTVVVLSNGSVVELSGWHDRVPAILEGWLLGQAGGAALADLLFGLAGPSGRLAETIPLRLEDTPSYLHFPGREGRAQYGEGIYVGYRGFDTLGTRVGYPFGHGLTYTEFEYSDVRAEAGPRPNTCQISFTLTNIGPRAGAEVAQLYIREAAPRLHRPVHELKAFAKVALEPGESAAVTLPLDERAFAHWSPAHRDWTISPGRFELQIGASSRDVRLRATVDMPGSGHRRPPTADSTIGEWIADPRGLALLGQAVGARGVDVTAIGSDPMAASFPLGRIAALLGLDPDAVGKLSAAAADELLSRSIGACLGCFLASSGPCSPAAGTRALSRCQPPVVGVPDPIAIAKTCSALISSPALALTVGSVTDATVLPASSGTDAK